MFLYKYDTVAMVSSDYPLFNDSMVLEGGVFFVCEEQTIYKICMAVQGMEEKGKCPMYVALDMAGPPVFDYVLALAKKKI